MKKILPVSILSANYNNELFLFDFFESILDSDCLPSQICITDDGSVDNSPNIIKKYSSVFKKKGVEFNAVFFEKNKGFGTALNMALELVNYDYTLRVDPDDILKPNRISFQYEFMKNHPECAILGSNIDYFLSEKNEKLWSSSVPLVEKEILGNLLSGCVPLIHGSTIFKSELIKKFKYIPGNVPAEDYDLFSRIKKANHILCNSPEVLTAVRIHGSSITNSIPYETIKKTFLLREEIWDIKFSHINSYRRFYNQKFYRNFLFKTSMLRFVYFLLAAIFWPESIFRSLRQTINS